jgi:radical SAM protein with 4Fe4S-binding SPASM domain
MQVRNKGQDLTKEIVDKVVGQIEKLGAETVNFGGNEPIYTNGLDIKKSLLPYIINQLTDLNITVGLTTSGLSAVNLEKHFNSEFIKLNDIDISIDSPIEEEHNNNRGRNVYKLAIDTLELCQKYNKDCSIVMCAMNWNFTTDRIAKLLELSKKYNANIRINMLKPTEKKHLEMMPSLEQIKDGYNYLVKHCKTLDMSDPVLAGSFDNTKVSGCSCGISSLRINSITADGKISVSPCVYMHNHKVGNLLTEDILDIINSDQFKQFSERKNNYRKIKGCENCKNLDICRGGCSAASYWYNFHKNNDNSMFNKDPYCIVKYENELNTPEFSEAKRLVHQNYLCTWIGKAK